MNPQWPRPDCEDRCTTHCGCRQAASKEGMDRTAALRTWSDTLVLTRPVHKQVRRVFLAELVSIAREEKNVRALEVHRATLQRALRSASRFTAAPEQQAAIRHLAELLFADVHKYHAAVRQFDRLMAEAALRQAPKRQGSPNRTVAAGYLHVHRNQLARMQRGGV